MTTTGPEPGLTPEASLWALITGQCLELTGGEAEVLLGQWRSNPNTRRAEVLALAAGLRAELLAIPADAPLDERLIGRLVLADLLLRHQP